MLAETPMFVCNSGHLSAGQSGGNGSCYPDDFLDEVLDHQETCNTYENGDRRNDRAFTRCVAKR